jgi:hypothetical protein
VSQEQNSGRSVCSSASTGKLDISGHTKVALERKPAKHIMNRNSVTSQRDLPTLSVYRGHRLFAYQKSMKEVVIVFVENMLSSS